jgi:polysaccharide pyruvyl transferase WcaK-like protein
MTSILPWRIMIWGGWYGSRNVGDQAVLLSIAQILVKILGKGELVVLTNNPAHVRSYLPGDEHLKVTPLATLRQASLVIRALKSCDLFVFGGAVPFFQQPKQLLAMSGLVSIARVFRVPYMTWSVSSQQVNSCLARLVFRWVLAGASGLTCRDAHTQQLFAACGCPGVPITADPVFRMLVDPTVTQDTLRRAGLQDGERPLAALTPRTLRTAQREAETHYRISSEAPLHKEIELYAAALDWLWEGGYQPVFVPMNTVPPDDDRLAARMIAEKAEYGSQAKWIDEAIPPPAAPGIYAACALSLVSRVHGSVAAALGGCPLAVYAFSPKQMGMMAALQMQDYILDENSSPGDVYRLLGELQARREPLRDHLLARSATLAEDALAPARLAAAILGRE